MLPGDRQNVEGFFVADPGDIGEVHQSLEANGCLCIEPALPNAVQLLLRVCARQHLTLGHERHELGVALDVADDIVEVVLVVVEDGLGLELDRVRGSEEEIPALWGELRQGREPAADTAELKSVHIGFIPICLRFKLKLTIHWNNSNRKYTHNR